MTTCISTNIYINSLGYVTWDRDNGASEDHGYAYVTNCVTDSDPFTDEDLRSDILGGLPPFPTNWCRGRGWPSGTWTLLTPAAVGAK